MSTSTKHSTGELPRFGIQLLLTMVVSMSMRTRDLSRYRDLPHLKHDSVEDVVAKPLQSSINSIKSNNRWFDFIYEDRGSDVTLIAFHAALSKKITSYPIFSSRGLAKKYDANYLGFADPACGSAESLPTFWHQSTKRVRSGHLIPRIIAHSLFSGSGKHPLFFGSSAGGFAALNYSAQFPGSATLVMNPRIDLLTQPNRFADYSASTYPGWSEEATKMRVQTNAAEIYRKQTNTTVAYIQNLQDSIYMDYHYRPFKEATVGNRNVYFRTGKWGKGHVVPPRDEFEKPLMQLIRCAPAWENALSGFTPNS